mgnify:CR=1 FL=1
MQLQYDNLASVPAEHANDFEEFNENGAVVAIPKVLVAAKKEALRTRGDLTVLQTKFDAYSSSHEKAKAEAAQLAEQAVVQARIEKDKAVAEQVEKLTAAGQLAEANQLKFEQSQEASALLVEENKSLTEKSQAQEALVIQKSNKSLSLEIATKYTTPDRVASLARLLEIDSVGFNDGLSVFKDASGGAIGNDIGNILASLDSDPNYSHFKTFTGGKPGVGAKGGQQTAPQAKTIYRDEFQALSPMAQAQKIKDGIKPINRP